MLGWIFLHLTQSNMATEQKQYFKKTKGQISQDTQNHAQQQPFIFQKKKCWGQVERRWETSNQTPCSVYSGCRRVTQSQSLCHYILWQILPLVGTVLHIFTYTFESFQWYPGCLLLKCNQPASDRCPLESPVRKIHVYISWRRKIKTILMQVPQCSWPKSQQNYVFLSPGIIWKKASLFLPSYFLEKMYFSIPPVSFGTFICMNHLCGKLCTASDANLF